MFLLLENSVAGINFSYSPGDVVEWENEAEANRLIERGTAVPLLDAAAAQAQAARTERGCIRKHRMPKP